MLLWFHRSHAFYSLKEIEKDGSKVSGISLMQIKDILAQLVGDNLVSVEKCGSTNIYWSFPFDVMDNCLKHMTAAEKRMTAAEIKRGEISDKLQVISSKAKKKRKAEDCEQLRLRIDSLKTEIQERTKHMQRLKEEASNTYVPMQTLTDAIGFYSDSIESMISYFHRTLGTSFDEALLRLELGIPTEFEEIPDLEPESPAFEVVSSVASKDISAV